MGEIFLITKTINKLREMPQERENFMKQTWMVQNKKKKKDHLIDQLKNFDIICEAEKREQRVPSFWELRMFQLEHTKRRSHPSALEWLATDPEGLYTGHEISSPSV